MKKGKSADRGVHIRRLRVRGRVLRDLIHGGGAPVIIDVVDVDADIGGDLINTPASEGKRKRKRNGLARVPKAITHLVLGAASVVGMVTASGIAYALGWA